MRVSTRLQGGIAILSLSGKFVAGTDGLLLRQQVKDVIDSGTRKLVFNFSEVPYIDSTGLGFLAGSRELAIEAGAIIVLAGMNTHVRRILDGVKLSQFFEIVEDESKGLARIEELGATTPVAPPDRESARQGVNSPARPTEAADVAQARRAAEE